MTKDAPKYSTPNKSDCKRHITTCAIHASSDPKPSKQLFFCPGIDDVGFLKKYSTPNKSYCKRHITTCALRAAGGGRRPNTNDKK